MNSSSSILDRMMVAFLPEMSEHKNDMESRYSMKCASENLDDAITKLYQLFENDCGDDGPGKNGGGSGNE